LAAAPTNPPLPTRNIAGTQMASLTQQPRSRIPEGALASWQTVQEQNARVFAQADQLQPPVPANFARPAITPIEPAIDASSASRPVSDGWYARRRDEAQAVRAAGEPNRTPPPSTQPPPAPLASSGEQPPQTWPQAVIHAEPLTPTAPLERQSAGSDTSATPLQPPAAADRRVLLEWTRPNDQPYRGAADLTGVALNAGPAQWR
jgi:hypothetical protein